MEFVRSVYYAAASFLLAAMAMAMIELAQGVQGAGTLFGSGLFEGYADIAGLISLGGPLFFLSAGLVTFANRSRPASGKTDRVPEGWGQESI